MQTFIGILLITVALLGSSALAVFILAPCGDALDHDNRRRSGKGNDCGCPLA